MSDKATVATPPATPAPTDQRSPADVAKNITKNIQEKANGKAPAVPPINGQPPANPSAIDPNAGKDKYVINGQDVWLNPEQARAYVQKGIAFEPRIAELDRLRKETQQFLETLKSDPARILFNPKIGLTPEDAFKKIMGSDRINDATKETVGQWYWENVVEPSKLTPEQLEARENKKKVSTYEQQEKKRQEESVQLENQERVQRAMTQIAANIAEAMKESGLPDNDSPLGVEMARMVADTMRIAHFQRQAITPKQAIELVKKRIKSVQAAYYDHLDGEKLVQELGEANAEKVKKYFLKLVKDVEAQVPSGQKNQPRVRSGERKTISPDEFHDYLEEIKKKG